MAQSKGVAAGQFRLGAMFTGVIAFVVALLGSITFGLCVGLGAFIFAVHYLDQMAAIWTAVGVSIAAVIGAFLCVFFSAMRLSARRKG